MAKMFYTLQEVAKKLGKSEDAVRAMAASGQIQEFRDRDRLMFKVDQIDLLAGGDEETGEVHLDLEESSSGSELGLSGTGTASGLPLSDSRDARALIDSKQGTGLGESDLDTGGGLSLSETGGIGLSDSREGTGSGSREGTGISVFDTDHGLEEEGAGTRFGERVDEDDLNLEAVGSGSGLLDLTRESDDTSLGAELLEEVYSGEENIELPANASGLFEAAGNEGGSDEAVAVSGVAAMPILVEAYDGTASGLGVGLMLGALGALVCVGIIVVVGIFGSTPDLAMTMAGNLWIWAGGLLGGVIVLGLIGFFVGKATE